MRGEVQVAPAVFEHAINAVGGQAVGHGEGGELFAVVAHDPFVFGHQPDMAGAILGDREGIDTGKGGEALAVVAQRAAWGGQPQGALAVFGDMPDPVLCQAVHLGIVEEGAAVIARQVVALVVPSYAGCTEPQVPAPVLVDGKYIVVGQTVQRGESPVGVSAHAPVGAKPQVAPPVLNDAHYGAAGQAVGAGETGEARSVVAGDAARGGKPQVALAVFADVPDAVVGQAVVDSEVLEAMAVVADEAVAEGAEPHMALAVFADGDHAVCGEAVCRGEIVESAPVVATDAGRRADPKVAGAIHLYCCDVVAGQAVLCGKGFELCAVIADQALAFQYGKGTRAEPQVALPVFRDVRYTPLGKSVPGGEIVEGAAVVATQAAFCADPQMALPILQHGIHPAGRQTVLLTEEENAFPVDVEGIEPHPTSAVFELGSGS